MDSWIEIGVYSRNMENNAPVSENVEQVEQKVIRIETPMQRSYDRIVDLAGGEKSSHLEQYSAARKYLLEIRKEGERLASINRSSQEMRENRQEEIVAAKLEEYFKFSLDSSAELLNRRGELERLIPGIATKLSHPGMDVDVNPDKKFSIAV